MSEGDTPQTPFPAHPQAARRGHFGKMVSFVRLPLSTKLLIAEAGAALAVGAVLAALPLRLYATWLGAVGVETAGEVSETQTERVRRIGWAIRMIASRVPFRSDCLPQAVAARILLGRRRIASTVYFGAAIRKSGDGQPTMEAHAWSRSGAIILTGNAARRGFKAVSMFGHEP